MTPEERREKKRLYDKLRWPSIKAAKREYDRLRYPEGGEACRQRSRAWALNNPEKKRATDKAYRAKNRSRLLDKKRAERERWLVYNRAWYQANKERIREYNLSRSVEARAHAATRRARKRAAGGNYFRADVERLLEQQNGQCVYCGCCIRDQFEVDHIVPLSRGGDNSAQNIQLLCRKCNRAKWNLMPAEFIAILQRSSSPTPAIVAAAP